MKGKFVTMWVVYESMKQNIADLLSFQFENHLTSREVHFSVTGKILYPSYLNAQAKCQCVITYLHMQNSSSMQ